MDFTTVVYANPEKTTHEAFHSKPAQRIELYYELMILIILVPGVLFVGALLWLNKKPKISDEKPGTVKI